MLTVVMLAALAVMQTPAPGRECRDDNGRDVCADVEVSRVEALLGLTPIAVEADSGAEIYRVRYVDGYGRDMPAISFERRDGVDPVVVVNGREGRKMTAPVSSETWNRVRAESRFADRTLELPPALPALDGRPVPPPPSCLHAWVVAVEMANSQPDGRKVEAVRSRTESACRGALTTRYAFLLADEAVKSLAPCGVLDGRRLRGTVGILEVCLGLEGDRFAAASLWNSKSTGAPREGLDRSDPGVWKAYLGTNGRPSLNWMGEQMVTERLHDDRVAAFIAEVIKGPPGLRFEPTRFRGVTSRRAQIEGVVLNFGNAPRRSADYVQTWVWDPNLSDWMVESWTVEPFRPMD